MTKTEDLGMQITSVLADSPLGLDEKIKALGMARSALTRTSIPAELHEWRTRRSALGVVGSGKKADEMRAQTKTTKGNSHPARGEKRTGR